VLREEEEQGTGRVRRHGHAGREIHYMPTRSQAGGSALVPTDPGL